MKIKQINTLLIANRGEIASRIIRTCRKLGIKSIAVFSDADSKALFVKEADIAIHIGESSPTESYLNQERIITVAQQQHADAIHPGYGFLSENAGFAKKCEQAGILFIGPNTKAIEAMGSKSQAKSIMKAHNVPVIPGYQGEDQSLETLTKASQKIGFPLLLKATAGGGGKGMRIVDNEAALENQMERAISEALSAFGDGSVFIEKYVASPRHIEFQILADNYGHVIHLFERECSIQRRHQKLTEETPSPFMTKKLRNDMGMAAVKAAEFIKYEGAGTVEFLVDSWPGYLAIIVRWFKEVLVSDLRVLLRLATVHNVQRIVGKCRHVSLNLGINNDMDYKQPFMRKCLLHCRQGH